MVSSRTTSDGELLRRAAAGDAEAFSIVYDRYEAIVAGFLVRGARDAELAADLTAETFAAAIGSVGRFRDYGQSAIGWLLDSARNVLARSHEPGQANDGPATAWGSSPSCSVTPR